MLRHDFPEAWPGVVDELNRLFHSQDGASWYAGLLIIHKLAKIYEYKRQTEKTPFFQLMNQLLPLLYARFCNIIDDFSQESNLLQKLMLKIFFCYIHVS